MLTQDQIKANINALERQGAKPQEIQGWLDSLKGKQPTTSTTTKKPLAERAFEGVSNFVAPIANTAGKSLALGYAQKLSEPGQQRQTELTQQVIKKLRDPNISDERKQMYVERLNAINPDIISQTPELQKTLDKTTLQILGETAITGLNFATPGLAPIKAAPIALKVASGATVGAAYGLAGAAAANKTKTGEILGSTALGAATGALVSYIGGVISKARAGAGKRAGEQMIKATQPSNNTLYNDFYYGTENIGDKMLQRGYKGGIAKMNEKATSELSEAGSQIGKILETAPTSKTIDKKTILTKISEWLNEAPRTKEELTWAAKQLSSVPEKFNAVESNQWKQLFAKKVPDSYWLADGGDKFAGNFFKKVSSLFRKETENIVPQIRSANDNWAIAKTLKELLTDNAIRESKKVFKGNLMGDIFGKTIGSTTVRTKITAPVLSGISDKNKILNFVGKLTPVEKSALLRYLTGSD